MKRKNLDLLCCFLKADSAAGSPIMRGIFQQITGIQIPVAMSVKQQIQLAKELMIN